MTLQPGKLPPDFLAALLAGIPAGEEVIVGSAPGEDAAVVEIPGHLDRYLVVASDPVTLSAEPGSYAVQVNANDIAVMGAEPRWMLASILLPEGTEERAVRAVMDGLVAGCETAGVRLIGGHTEITTSVNRPVVAATMIGLVAPDGLVTSSGGRPGDALLLVGPIAVEGTAILAAEYGELLRSRGVAEGVLAKAKALLERPGVSVLPAVRVLTGAVSPHAMHDPTEGGVLSAARELALASGVGLRLDLDRVPVLPACREICAALGLNPFALLASGSLLAAIYPGDVDRTPEALRAAGIEAAVIGELLTPTEGLSVIRNGEKQEYPDVERDELARLSGSAPG